MNPDGADVDEQQSPVVTLSVDTPGTQPDEKSEGSVASSEKRGSEVGCDGSRPAERVTQFTTALAAEKIDIKMIRKMCESMLW